MEPITDLFGNQVKPEVIANKKGAKLIDKIHAAWGITQGEACKNCVHFVRKGFSKTYFKCGLARDTASESTDIRANDIACGKFERESEKVF